MTTRTEYQFKKLAKRYPGINKEELYYYTSLVETIGYQTCIKDSMKETKWKK